MDLSTNIMCPRHEHIIRTLYQFSRQQSFTWMKIAHPAHRPKKLLSLPDYLLIQFKVIFCSCPISSKVLILQHVIQITSTDNCLPPLTIIYKVNFPTILEWMQASGCARWEKHGRLWKMAGSGPFVAMGWNKQPLQWSFNPCLSRVYRVLAQTRTEVPHFTHPHACKQPGTIKANCCGGPAVCNNPEKDISELLGARNGQLCEQAAVIKMTSAPWKLCIVPFPQGKSQAYFQLYFTADNSIWILVSQLGP